MFVNSTSIFVYMEVYNDPLSVMNQDLRDLSDWTMKYVKE